MAFPPSFLEELRARIDLGEVVGRHVKLIRRGREYVGLSPFQTERTPSFTVVPEKGFYHCFSSGEHGDVIDFVMKVEGLTFPDAVERLAAQAGMQMPVDTPEEREKAEKRKSLYDVVEAATRHFERCLRLPEGKAALDYLHRRGLDDATIARFRLGYAPDSHSAIKGALAREGMDENALVEAGLLIRPDDAARKPYDRFRHRVMFPITDRRGRPIAFGGRILAEGEPKYLNSPETPLFHKGAVLYGLHQAARSAAERKQVVVAEGYMDVIAMAKAGIENTVAPLGTALTEEQFALLWRMAPEAVLCFDGDRAGQRAAARAATRALPLLRPEVVLRFAELPTGEDPDSLIAQKGPAAMAALIDSALSLSDALWRIESGGRLPGSPEGRAALQKRLEDHAQAIQDPTVRSHFRRAFRERLWPKRPPAGGRNGRAGGGSGGRNGNRDKTWQSAVSLGAGEFTSKPIDSDAWREQILLATLLRRPEIFDHVGERLGMLSFSAPELDILRQEVLKTLSTEPDLDRPGLERHLRLAGCAAAVDAVLSPKVLAHAFFARPDTPVETVQEGWDETYGRCLQGELLAEIGEAERLLAGDPSDNTFDRVRRLMALRHGDEADDRTDRRDEGYDASTAGGRKGG